MPGGSARVEITVPAAERADADAAERPRQRVADEDALARHQDALPVRLDQRLAGEVVRHDDADLGELRAEAARLGARAVAAGRARREPVERGRLVEPSEAPPNDVRWSAIAPSRKRLLAIAATWATPVNSNMTSVLPSSASASTCSIGYAVPSTARTRSYVSARTLRPASLVFIR